MDESDLSYFDPQAEWSIVERGLPHWGQAGCVCFVTWRLIDSLPVEVLRRLDREIEQFLLANDLDPVNWKQQLAGCDAKVRGRVQWKLFSIRDKFLDSRLGACQLRDPTCARIVIDSLLQFDTERYFLTDAVVMPNHVHFLVAFPNDESFLKQCTEWKRFTARTINRQLGTEGKFWQQDQFDHLVRSPEQFEHYRRYIANNPTKAKLPSDSFLHFQKPLT